MWNDHCCYSRLPNVTTKRKEPHACTIGWNIDSNKPHASPGLYSSNAFVVIKALPISSSKSHIVLNKPHASLFGHCIEMNKPSVRNKAIGCYIPHSRVLLLWRQKCCFLNRNTSREFSQKFVKPFEEIAQKNGKIVFLLYKKMQEIQKELNQ